MKTLRDSAPNWVPGAEDRPCGLAEAGRLSIDYRFCSPNISLERRMQTTSAALPHSAPRALAGQQMRMDVIHLLPAARPGIYYRTKAGVTARVGNTKIFRQTSDQTHHSTKQRSVTFCAV